MRKNFMKQISFLFILLFSIKSFAITNGKEAIDILIHQFVKAYEKQDVGSLINFYAPEALVIGTGSDEVIQGKTKILESFKRDFNQSSKASISIEKIAINQLDNTAIASYYMDVNVTLPNEKVFKEKLRCTLAFFKEKNSWHIIQSHISAPLANQKINESFPHR